MFHASGELNLRRVHQHNLGASHSPADPCLNLKLPLTVVLKTEVV